LAWGEAAGVGSKRIVVSSLSRPFSLRGAAADPAQLDLVSPEVYTPGTFRVGDVPSMLGQEAVT